MFKNDKKEEKEQVVNKVINKIVQQNQENKEKDKTLVSNDNSSCSSSRSKYIRPLLLQHTVALFLSNRHDPTFLFVLIQIIHKALEIKLLSFSLSSILLRTLELKTEVGVGTSLDISLELTLTLMVKIKIIIIKTKIKLREVKKGKRNK